MISARPPIGAVRRLTLEQIADYQGQGWVRAAGFFAPEAVAAISRWTDEILERPQARGEHMVYYEPDFRTPDARIVQRIEFFCGFHPEFEALVQGDLRTAVADLLGAPARLFKEKINFKLPGGAGFEPHQDQQAGWSAYAPLFVTALVSIDAATLENGCLEMAHGPRPAQLIGEEWRPLQPGEMAGLDLRPIPTAPGDVLFFDSYAPHASKRNETEAARRILYLTYNRSADGDHRARYFADKRASFPPDIERDPAREYRFRV
jgi:ectoine hydroxylase-related dioxygenase (phytanoyl-CoA dioxygenase family)